MANWYYSVKGKAEGPVDEKFILESLKLGRFTLVDLVYREGDTAWCTLGEIPQFREAFQAPPLPVVEPAFFEMAEAIETIDTNDLSLESTSVDRHLDNDAGDESTDPIQNIPSNGVRRDFVSLEVNAGANLNHWKVDSAIAPEWVVLKPQGEGYVQAGPFTVEQICEKLGSGEIQYSQYAWKSGYKRWVRIGNLPEFDRRRRDRDGDPVNQIIPIPENDHTIPALSREELLGNIIRMERPKPPPAPWSDPDEKPEDAEGYDLLEPKTALFHFGGAESSESHQRAPVVPGPSEEVMTDPLMQRPPPLEKSWHNENALDIPPDESLHSSDQSHDQIADHEYDHEQKNHIMDDKTSVFTPISEHDSSLTDEAQDDGEPSFFNERTVVAPFISGFGSSEMKSEMRSDLNRESHDNHDDPISEVTRDIDEAVQAEAAHDEASQSQVMINDPSISLKLDEGEESSGDLKRVRMRKLALGFVACGIAAAAFSYQESLSLDSLKGVFAQILSGQDVEDAVPDAPEPEPTVQSPSSSVKPLMAPPPSAPDESAAAVSVGSSDSSPNTPPTAPPSVAPESKTESETVAEQPRSAPARSEPQSPHASLLSKIKPVRPTQSGATVMDIVPLALSSSSPLLVFQTNAAVGEVIKVTIKARSGEILKLPSYSRRVSVRRSSGEVASLDLGKLRLPPGTYHVVAAAGRAQKARSIFIGSNDAKFKTQLEQHLKQIAPQQQSERKALFYSARRSEELARTLGQSYTKLRSNTKKWNGFYSQWKKDVSQAASGVSLHLSAGSVAYPDELNEFKVISKDLLEHGRELNEAVLQKRNVASDKPKTIVQEFKRIKQEAARLSGRP